LIQAGIGSDHIVLPVGLAAGRHHFNASLADDGARLRMVVRRPVFVRSLLPGLRSVLAEIEGMA